MDALMKTKGWKDANLSGKVVLGGSDPVSWKMIYEFVYHGALVIPNWGMSEIGPITINTAFYELDQVLHYRHLLDKGTILGDRVYCDTKIVDGELYVKGPTCFTDDWYPTGDLVEKKNEIFSYTGRK
jgi:hypothetical protein